ncbi:hydantoinase B/oxoprolinase family protein [Streptomyces sp. cg40]|uniref:hydantoinase B/oxoprolinase family protein n=1 Tax=Streptomyces sp. cg40 TaxID=3419764 RepID=UPI003CFD29E1
MTYEVVRYSLLNINIEHNALLQKLAVSQVIILSRDYQTALLTEDGEVLFVGPGVQYFANTASLCVQYTLENRSGNPGIHPGDMFIINDSFVGAPHQMDTCVAAPVFVGDELFCWVTNTLHYQDVGGTAPGSFCHDATDAFQEGLHWPPVRIVEAGRLRDDVERLFARQSRFPELVGMDLRAAIAADEHARRKIAALVGRYGADVVKGVMQGTLKAGERLFAERLRSIPDGRWSHRFYTEGTLPGDRSVQTLQVNLTKVGDRVYVDNRGTDPQAGSISMTFGPFAGSVLAGMMGQIVADLGGAYGGAYRLVEFRLEPGTILCADYPAAVSPTPFTATNLVNAVAIATAKMLSCGDEATARLILGAQFTHPGGSTGLAGVDLKGGQFVVAGGEMMLGSFGGSPWRDGPDFGGHWWIPSGIGPNVEDLESFNPIVYLYRRALPAGLDGAGRHRGGLGFVYGMTLRGTAGGMVLYTMGEAFPKGAGLLGAAPGSRAHVKVVQGSDVFDRLRDGHVPVGVEELAGEQRELPWKTQGHPLVDGDVLEGLFPSVAGWGDPLRRDPAAVLVDIEEHGLTAEAAARVYGVLLRDGAAGLDAQATARRRRELRGQRLAGADPGEPVPAPRGARRVGELLHVVDGRWWCNGADLGPADGNYKDAAVVRESPIRSIGPEFECSDPELADRVVLREYICPVTGFVIDSEIVLCEQSPLHDLHIRL